MERPVNYRHEIGEILVSTGAITVQENDSIRAKQQEILQNTKVKKLYGQVATDELKLVSEKTLHSCLIGQAAGRIAWVGEKHEEHIKTPVTDKDGVKKFDVADSNFTRSYIGKDKAEPQTLVQTQALGHLAALLDGAAQITPSLDDKPQIKEGRKALQVIAGHEYTKAASVMREALSEMPDGDRKTALAASAKSRRRTKSTPDRDPMCACDTGTLCEDLPR